MNKTICENANLMQNLQLLKDMGYKYVAKAQDKCLSGWGHSNGTKHIQLIACRDFTELDRVLSTLRMDYTMAYVNWYFISDKKGIYNTTRNKTYTVRNDWIS